MSKERASTLSTLIALAISFLFGWLLGVLVLSGSRPNAWYDMDFSIWMVCLLYAFIHILIGKILSLGVSGMLRSLGRNTNLSFEQHWTENMQMVFASLWPVSIPAAIIAYPLLLILHKKKA